MAFLLSALKGWFVPSGSRPRSIKFGAFKGLKMNLDLRHHTQMWLGLTEREVYSCLRRFAEPARTGVDVGAAEGEFTLYYRSLPNMRHVLAFDPSDRFPGEVAANLALNGFNGETPTRLIRKFVGDRDDDTHCTLDALVSDLEGPCVVKVDVEGAEAAVLRGSSKLLDRKDVSWIIETHSAELEIECEKILGTKGYATKVIRNAWWRAVLPERRLIPHNRWLAAWRGHPLTDDNSEPSGQFYGTKSSDVDQ